eukprot:jgi/Tetstr1/424251/TSEL_014820.t1
MAHKFLVCYGFQQLNSDPGAYVYWHGGERDWDNARLKVHQAKYIDDMLHKFNLACACAVSTPAEIGADIPGSNKPLAAEVPYQTLVCSVLDAMVATRPNIAEAVSKLCRVMAKPEERH